MTTHEAAPTRALSETVNSLRQVFASGATKPIAWRLAQVEAVERLVVEREADIAEAIDFVEYYAGAMARLDPPPCLGRYPGELNELCWVPRGLTAVIAP